MYVKIYVLQNLHIVCVNISNMSSDSISFDGATDLI